MNKLISYYLTRFYRDQRGVYGVIMFLITIFLVGSVGFVVQSSHMYSQKARLSDGLEQAVLAVTVENNNYKPDMTKKEKYINDMTNKNLVDSYVKSYIPDSSQLNFHTTCYRIECPTCQKDFVYCGVSGKFAQDSLFPVSIPLPDRNYNIVPEQVRVGSSAYARLSYNAEKKTPFTQDVILAVNLGPGMDASWNDLMHIDKATKEFSLIPYGKIDPKEQETLQKRQNERVSCLEGLLVSDRAAYASFYRNHCMGNATQEELRALNTADASWKFKPLPFSAYSFLGKTLFAENLKDWGGMSYFKNANLEKQAEGVLASFFDPKKDFSAAVDEETGASDRVRLVVSDFGYPDPSDPNNYCIFPFAMNLLKLNDDIRNNNAYYDYFMSDQNYAWNRPIKHNAYNFFWSKEARYRYNYAYRMGRVTSPDFFWDRLGDAFAHLNDVESSSYKTVHTGKYRLTAVGLKEAMVFSSLLLNYFSPENTIQMVTGKANERVVRFVNKTKTKNSGRYPFASSMACMSSLPNTGVRPGFGVPLWYGDKGSDRSEAVSPWINVAKVEEKDNKPELVPNVQGLKELRRIYAKFIPSRMSFLPTSLVQAAQNALSGDDNNRQKVIVLIGTTTQSLVDWTAGSYNGSGVDSKVVVAEISPPVRVSQTDPYFAYPTEDRESFKLFRRPDYEPECYNIKKKAESGDEAYLKEHWKPYAYKRTRIQEWYPGFYGDNDRLDENKVDCSRVTWYLSQQKLGIYHVFNHGYQYCDVGVEPSQITVLTFNHFRYAPNQRICEGRVWDPSAQQDVGITSKTDPETGNPIGWVSVGSKDKPVAVPNPLMDAIPKKELSYLPSKYSLWNRVPYLEAVFQRMQYELLVKYNMCQKIRNYLSAKTGEDTIIAVILLSDKKSPSEPYWENCVNYDYFPRVAPGAEPPLGAKKRRYLFHVYNPTELKQILSGLLVKPVTEIKQTRRVLNINYSNFEEERKSEIEKEKQDNKQ